MLNVTVTSSFWSSFGRFLEPWLLLRLYAFHVLSLCLSSCAINRVNIFKFLYLRAITLFNNRGMPHTVGSLESESCSPFPGRLLCKPAAIISSSCIGDDVVSVFSTLDVAACPTAWISNKELRVPIYQAMLTSEAASHQCRFCRFGE